MILESGSIPTRDLFSHTMLGAPLTPHEWLAQVLFAGIHNLMGLDGVVWLSALVIALAFRQVYLQALSQGAQRLPAAALTLFAAFASSIHWLARPHIFTFLLLAIWVTQLSRLERLRARDLWFFPALMLVWANIHGAFIAGFVTWGAYLAGAIWEQVSKRGSITAIKRLAGIGVVSFAASLLNPSGWHLWQTSLGYIQNRYLVGITQEYLSPDFHQINFAPFLLFLALTAFILAQKEALMRMRDTLLIAGWIVMALYSARNIPLMVIISVPILSASIKLPMWLSAPETALQNIENLLRPGLWSIMIVLIVLALMAANLMPTPANVYDSAIFPVEAVTWLETNPQSGNVFNHFTWGGYLLYRLYPAQEVFIDGQTDFYGEALTREYVSVTTLSPGWENVLNKYKIKWILIPTKSALAHALAEKNWEILYEDPTAIIFQR